MLIEEVIGGDYADVLITHVSDVDAFADVPVEFDGVAADGLITTDGHRAFPANEFSIAINCGPEGRQLPFSRLGLLAGTATRRNSPASMPATSVLTTPPREMAAPTSRSVT